MKRFSIYELARGEVNVLDGTLPVGRLLKGGLHFYDPGEVSHASEERHVHHDHYEVFVCVQGRGAVEVEGIDRPFEVGDILLIEPGESHHVRSDEMDPLVNFYFGARMSD
ncbi:MAG: cupin domain-containing protein [Theionarchaea archaeon]|nr:cupin domain-containing protein [Theionarchaea archaeon]